MARITSLFVTLLSVLVTLALAGSNHGTSSGKPIEKRSAREIIAALGLTANPEKGYFVETYRDPLLVNGTRSINTAIYYLIEGKVGNSLWHRIDVPEIWHYYAGAPLTLSLSWNNGTGVRKYTLGPNILEGPNTRPQIVIKGWEWQRVKSLGDWTLVGTTVSPGFDPAGYEIADGNWNPS
ncbi:RmlC-like cupin domain-containing protein [Cladorrhinum sp. PSN259]|nr:RmlC-like cupin domain-containing protein [Cladorrhinum sp. PSN259]